MPDPFFGDWLANVDWQELRLLFNVMQFVCRLAMRRWSTTRARSKKKPARRRPRRR